jgi:hypothetical protein
MAASMASTLHTQTLSGKVGSLETMSSLGYIQTGSSKSAFFALDAESQPLKKGHLTETRDPRSLTSVKGQPIDDDVDLIPC